MHDSIRSRTVEVQGMVDEAGEIEAPLIPPKYRGLSS